MYLVYICCLMHSSTIPAYKIMSKGKEHLYRAFALNRRMQVSVSYHKFCVLFVFMIY